MRNVLFLVPLALAACATAPIDPPIVNPGGTCRDEGLAQFVGQPATAEVGARIHAQSGAAIFRWLPDGTIITMEFNGNRVNANLDRENRITAVRCG